MIKLVALVALGLLALWAIEALLVLVSLRADVRSGSAEPSEPLT